MRGTDLTFAPALYDAVISATIARVELPRHEVRWRIFSERGLTIARTSTLTIFTTDGRTLLFAMRRVDAQAVLAAQSPAQD